MWEELQYIRSVLFSKFQNFKINDKREKIDLEFLWAEINFNEITKLIKLIEENEIVTSLSQS